MDADFRVFGALRFAVGDGSYAAQRESLERTSWLVVDAFRVANLCAVVSSYPGWTNIDDMGDFGMIHPTFPVNGIDCLCIQVQPSPLRESFSDPNDLAQASPECRKTVTERGSLQMGTGVFSNMPVDDAWNACIDDFRNAGFTKSMQRVVSIQGFTTGFLSLSTGGTPSPVRKGDFEANLFSFWLNLISRQPREIALEF
jgi:hypothetical protein